MSKTLGGIIRKRREELRIGLRELARRIHKSPSFLAILENDESPPSASEETIRALARELRLDPDELIPLAGKTPEEVAPNSALDVALYRQVKRLPRKEKEDLLQRLEQRSKPKQR